jgi:hypothetical protein
MQSSNAAGLTEYFARLLPEQTGGSRPNIKRYGRRFAYLSGVKQEEEFFFYAAQFGMGLVVWGIAMKPEVPVGARGFGNH